MAVFLVVRRFCVVLVGVLAISSCGEPDVVSRQPPVPPTSQPEQPATPAARATSSDESLGAEPTNAVECPAKVAPPARSVSYAVTLPDGTEGANPGNNTWVLNVISSTTVSLPFTVHVEPGTAVESLAFELRRGNGVVAELHRTGRLDSGSHGLIVDVAPGDVVGRLHLKASAVIAHDERYSCVSLAGSQTGAGLGYVDVFALASPSPPPTAADTGAFREVDLAPGFCANSDFEVSFPDTLVTQVGLLDDRTVSCHWFELRSSVDDSAIIFIDGNEAFRTFPEFYNEIDVTLRAEVWTGSNGVEGSDSLDWLIQTALRSWLEDRSLTIDLSFPLDEQIPAGVTVRDTEIGARRIVYLRAVGFDAFNSVQRDMALWAVEEADHLYAVYASDFGAMDFSDAVTAGDQIAASITVR